MNFTKQQFQQLLNRYIQGKASPEEEKLLDLFFESYQKENLAETVDQLDEKTQSELLQRISRTIPWKKEHRTLKFALKIAASIGFIFFVGYILTARLVDRPDSPARFVKESTKKGEKLSIQLPDGTHVVLNAESSITYPEAFVSKKREITLTGEAYFEVVHNLQRPFIIYAQNSQTEVVGTSFNINTVKYHKTEVTLVEGKIKVRGDSGNSSVLTPGQQASIDYATSSITTKAVEVAKFISWKDNTIYFEETTLKNAIVILENWYNVDIELLNDSQENCKITAKYRDEPLENVLKSLQFLLKIEYNMDDGGRIIINGTGCK